MAETVGTVRVEFQGNTAQLEASLAAARKAVGETGASFSNLTDTATQASRKLVATQQAMGAAMLELTGTDTERQLAAVDARYAKLLAKARKYGLDTAQLEAALAAKKRQIRLADEQDALRGSDAVGAASRKAAAGLDTASRAAGGMAGNIKALGNLGKVAHAQVGQLTGGLQLLATTGLNPVAAGLAIVAAGIFYYTEKLDEARKATMEYLNTTRQQQLGLKQLAIDVKHAEEETTGADLDKQRVKIESMRAHVEELDRMARGLEDRALSKVFSGKKDEAQKAADAARAELATMLQELPLMERMNEIEKARAAREWDKQLRALQERVRLERGLINLGERDAQLVSQGAAIREKYAGLMDKLKNTEEDTLRRRALEFQQGLELEALIDRTTAQQLRGAREMVEGIEREVGAREEAVGVTDKLALANARVTAQADEALRRMDAMTAGIVQQDPAYQALRDRILEAAAAQRQLNDVEAARDKAEAYLKVQEDLAAAMLDLQQATTREEAAAAAAKFQAALAAAQAGGELLISAGENLLAAQRAQLEADMAAELASLDRHYAELIKRAEEAGIDTAQLEEGLATQRALVRDRYARTAVEASDKIADEEQRALEAGLKLADEGSAGFDKLGRHIRKAAEDAKGFAGEMTAAQRASIKALANTYVFGLRVNSTPEEERRREAEGRRLYPWLYGVQGTWDAAGNFIPDPAPGAMGGGGQVTIQIQQTVNNQAAGDGYGVTNTLVPDGRGGMRLVTTVAQDIRRGGDTAKALEATYGLRPKGTPA